MSKNAPDEATYFWLSFADDEQSLGCAIVRAADMKEAARRAWETDCNPGGEILGVGPFTMSEASPEIRTLPLHTLLSRDEVVDAGVKLTDVDEEKEETLH